MANDEQQQREYQELYAAKGINALAVDESILEQPQLFGHCAAWCAIVNSRRDDLKDAMENIASDIDLKVRDHFTETGEKVTEARIAAMVRVSPEYKEAQHRYNKARALAGKWNGLIESYKQRSYSLTQYVNWRSGDYIHEREGSQRAHSGRARQ